jgi:hypothetical protein
MSNGTTIKEGKGEHVGSRRVSDSHCREGRSTKLLAHTCGPADEAEKVQLDKVTDAFPSIAPPDWPVGDEGMEQRDVSHRATENSFDALRQGVCR